MQGWLYGVSAAAYEADTVNFIWPGFGDNMRVLDWIIKRCDGEIDAEETAIGSFCTGTTT